MKCNYYLCLVSYQDQKGRSVFDSISEIKCNFEKLNAKYFWLYHYEE